jgi:hypothetical protein
VSVTVLVVDLGEEYPDIHVCKNRKIAKRRAVQLIWAFIHVQDGRHNRASWKGYQADFIQELKKRIERKQYKRAIEVWNEGQYMPIDIMDNVPLWKKQHVYKFQWPDDLQKRLDKMIQARKKKDKHEEGQ